MNDAASRAAERPRVRRISDLLGAAKRELENRFSDFWLEGELSDVKKPSSGHVYFTLVEPGAQVRGVMWRGDASRTRTPLVDGAKVWLLVTLEAWLRRVVAAGAAS